MVVVKILCRIWTSFSVTWSQLNKENILSPQSFAAVKMTSGNLQSNPRPSFYSGYHLLFVGLSDPTGSGLAPTWR
jgi:hypothetical protein